MEATLAEVAAVTRGLPGPPTAPRRALADGGGLRPPAPGGIRQERVRNGPRSGLRKRGRRNDEAPSSRRFRERAHVGSSEDVDPLTGFQEGRTARTGAASGGPESPPSRPGATPRPVRIPVRRRGHDAALFFPTGCDQKWRTGWRMERSPAGCAV